MGRTAHRVSRLARQERDGEKMKSRSVRYAALMTALLLACIGFPAIAQGSASVSANADHSSAFSNRTIDFSTGIYDASGASCYLASSINLWVPVRDPDHDSRKGHRKIVDRHLTVPEGGSPFLYLLLAALSCCGALVFLRRRAHAQKT